MMHDEARKALLHVTKALLETVQEAGERGAPAGPLYAAVMTVGISLNAFEQIMGALVQARMVRKSGHVYFAA